MRPRIKALLAERGLTMRWLASAMGVHEITVSRWCTPEGFGGMRMRDAEGVAYALRCRVSDLFDEGKEVPGV